MKKSNHIIIDLTNNEIVVPSAEIKNRLEGKGGFAPLSLEDLYHISNFKVVRKLKTLTQKGDKTTLNDIQKKIKSIGDNNLIEELQSMIDNNTSFFKIKKWYKETVNNK